VCCRTRSSYMTPVRWCEIPPKDQGTRARLERLVDSSLVTEGRGLIRGTCGCISSPPVSLGSASTPTSAVSMSVGSPRFIAPCLGFSGLCHAWDFNAPDIYGSAGRQWVLSSKLHAISSSLRVSFFPCAFTIFLYGLHNQICSPSYSFSY